MKKSILVTFFILSMIGSYAQQVPVTNNNKTTATDNLILKAKKLNTAGWTFLATGTVMVAVGFAMFPKNYDLLDENKSKDNLAFASILVTVLGGAALIASIPLLATAAAKRHKATLLLSNEKTGMGIPIQISKDIPGLTMRISLGKSHQPTFKTVNTN